MTAAFQYEYEELHRLVDLLPIERARALLAVAIHLVNDKSSEQTDHEPRGGRRRRLSFAGIMEAEPDLAARSEEILRDEVGRTNA